MATRSEQFHSDAQKTGSSTHVSRGKRAKKSSWKRASAHAARKATHALEEHGDARPSRVSSRASANRAKGDAALVHEEEMTKGAPANRARRSRAAGARVRGS